jgi:hypothetical protein
MMGRSLGATAATLACAVALAGCYDSRWGQAKASQKRLAARATPGEVATTPGGSHAGGVHRTYRIRLRPNAHYLAQTADPERQLEALIEDADRVLEPTIGLQLEADKARPWSFDGDDRLEPALAALRQDDAGDDVDVVVGLIGALPRPTESLHEVGYAELLGKHMVVRAASRAGEHDAVEQAFVDLSQDERDRVVRARRRHRALTVFLHELGHVLGALHEADVTSVMHPAYDEKMTAYGEDAVVLMRLALGEGDRAAVVKAQLDYLRASKAASWAPGERDAAVARLEAMSAPPQALPAPLASTATGARVDGPPGLSADDRDRYAKASEMFRAGRVASAYDAARPLFATHPTSLPVQDLRCQLATVRWLEPRALVEECAAYTRLTADAGGGGKN